MKKSDRKSILENLDKALDPPGGRRKPALAAGLADYDDEPQAVHPVPLPSGGQTPSHSVRRSLPHFGERLGCPVDDRTQTRSPLSSRGAPPDGAPCSGDTGGRARHLHPLRDLSDAVPQRRLHVLRADAALRHPERARPGSARALRARLDGPLGLEPGSRAADLRRRHRVRSARADPRLRPHVAT